jgi:hypothetical protein
MTSRFLRQSALLMGALLVSTLVWRGVSEAHVSRELGVEVGRGAELWFEGGFVKGSCSQGVVRPTGNNQNGVPDPLPRCADRAISPRAVSASWICLTSTSCGSLREKVISVRSRTPRVSIVGPECRPPPSTRFLQRCASDRHIEPCGQGRALSREAAPASRRRAIKDDPGAHFRELWRTILTLSAATRWREQDVPGDLLRLSFGNVTVSCNSVTIIF